MPSNTASADWRETLIRRNRRTSGRAVTLGPELARFEANRLWVLLSPTAMRDLRRQLDKVLVIHEAGLRLLPWGTVVRFSEVIGLDNLDQRHLGDGSVVYGTLRIHTRQREYRIDRTFQDPSRAMKFIHKLAGPFIKDQVDRRLVKLRARLAEGWELTFGPLVVSERGLREGRALHPWDSIEVYGRDRDRLVVLGGGLTLMATRLASIPRYRELLHVLERLAPRASPRSQG